MGFKKASLTQKTLSYDLFSLSSGTQIKLMGLETSCMINGSWDPGIHWLRMSEKLIVFSSRYTLRNECKSFLRVFSRANFVRSRIFFNIQDMIIWFIFFINCNLVQYKEDSTRFGSESSEVIIPRLKSYICQIL